MIANTPSPPYYAVIFTSIQNNPTNGYAEITKKTLHLAEQEKGFFGAESAREDIVIIISYWKTLGDIKR